MREELSSEQHMPEPQRAGEVKEADELPQAKDAGLESIRWPEGTEEHSVTQTREGKNFRKERVGLHPSLRPVDRMNLSCRHYLGSSQKNSTDTLHMLLQSSYSKRFCTGFPTPQGLCIRNGKTVQEIHGFCHSLFLQTVSR